MSIAKLSKSIIRRMIITSTLTISLVLCSISVAFGAVATADDLAGQLSTGWIAFAENDYELGVPSDMSTSWYAKYGNKTLKALQSINYQLSGSSYNTTSGNNLFTFVNNINQSLNSPNTGIYGLLQTQNLKLDAINTTLGTGSSLSNVLTKLEAIVNWTSNTNSGVQSLVTNGIDINAPALDDIFDLLNTPVLEPFTYVYRSAINTNGSFTSSSNNGYVVGIRTDETTGALRFGQQTLNSQMDYLGIIHNDLLGLNNRLQTMATEYNPVLYGQDGTSYSYQSFSILDSLTMYGNNHGRMLNDILQNDINFRDEYNKITWTEWNGIVGIKKSPTGNYISSNTSSRDFYVDITNGSYKTKYYKFELPIVLYDFGQNVDIEIRYINGNIDVPLVYNLDYTIGNFQPLTIYLSLDRFRQGNPSFTIHLHGSQGFASYTTTYRGASYYIPLDTKDGIDIANNIYLSNILALFKQAKEMYFDDESIQAKKNNAGQTTAVITNFTGSGQASATANDYGTLSSGVNDVKGGMTTNVSANSAFGIFNNSNGYSFWSAETLQELNQSGTTTNINNRKSFNDSEYEYYNNRIEYLLNVMNGGDKK